MQDIDKTKRKLTIVFTIILVFFFFCVGIGFFYLKYNSSKISLKNNFQSLKESTIDSKEEIIKYIKTNQNEILNYPFKTSETNKPEEIIDFIFDDIDYIISNIDSIKTVQSVPIQMKNQFPIFKEKIIFLSEENTVIFTNLVDYKYLDYGEAIRNKEETIFYQKNNVIGKFYLGKYTALIFLKEEYNLESLKKDITGYFLIILLLSFFIYILVFLLIRKGLKPIGENIDSMNTFIHNAGHELKTPLASINSSMGLLEKTGKYDKELVLESISELKRANKLLETLRDLSSLSSIKDKEIFGVSERIKYISSILKKELQSKKITLKINTTLDFEIKSNKYYFDILISNILSNAIKYNKENGTIEITISKPELKIKDSGIGIPAKDQKKIFDKFYRVKKHRDREGVGLGLSIAAKIVDINKWKIKVKSEENQGTEFTLKF